MILRRILFIGVAAAVVWAGKQASASETTPKQAVNVGLRIVKPNSEFPLKEAKFEEIRQGYAKTNDRAKDHTTMLDSELSGDSLMRVAGLDLLNAKALNGAPQSGVCRTGSCPVGSRPPAYRRV